MTEILSRLFYAGFVRLHILYHAAEEPICGVDHLIGSLEPWVTEDYLAQLEATSRR